ncbi:MAG: DUF6513 domain-containing protein [Planctomycetota bacterium]
MSTATTSPTNVRQHPDDARPHYVFVTGRLAAAAVRETVAAIAARHDFEYEVTVLPITVAALMTPRWIMRHLKPDSKTTHVVVPGYCNVNDPAWDALQPRLVVGPRDLRRLPELFGETIEKPDLSQQNIEIIAEINHAPRMSIQQVVSVAGDLIGQGADRIDIGCCPGQPCANIADYVREVVSLGIPVSLDSFDTREAEQGINAGASLLLSATWKTRHWAHQLGCEVVVIPQPIDDENNLKKTVDFFLDQGTWIRVDPILEPIGTGFGNSLVRYHHIRQTYPEVPMMMGIGNLTELSDVDSAGINFLLLGVCAEWNIGSVLTTQVINWARSSVAECDIARRLVHHAVTHRVPPKNLSSDLVVLRDTRLRHSPKSLLDSLANELTDPNYRLFVDDDAIRLLAANVDLRDDDPFRLFDRLLALPESRNVDAGHAFYLGYEMAKAALAIQLGKNYEQDRALDWGHLTVQEDLHRIKRTSAKRRPKPQ